MAEAYRFNGPVPEAVKQLKRRVAGRVRAASDRRSLVAYAHEILNDPAANERDRKMANGILSKGKARPNCSISFLESSEAIQINTIPKP